MVDEQKLLARITVNPEIFGGKPIIRGERFADHPSQRGGARSLALSVKRPEVAHSVPLQVFLVYRDFKRCTSCHRVYWRGSHLSRLDKIVERARNATSAGQPAEEPCVRLRR